MITYEVNLELDHSIYQAFLDWLPVHIEEILCLAGFKSADIFEESNTKITVQYQLTSMEDLQNYFDYHANTLRNKTVKLFGDKFKASRRILKLTRSFHHISEK